MKYLAHKNSDEIKYIDLIKIIENALPEDIKNFSINVINSIIIGFANNYYPILQSLVPEIQSSYGITINKNFNIDSIDFKYYLIRIGNRLGHKIQIVGSTILYW